MKINALLKFELKKQLKTSLIYSAVWSALIFLFISFFDVIRQNTAQISQLYESFPKGLLDAFGKGQASLTSIYGYFANQIAIYLIMAGCIFAIFLVVGTMTKEIESKHMLFLLSKPLSRLQIYIAKLTAILVGLFMSDVILFVAAFVAISILSKETNLDWGFFALVFAAVFIMETFFVGVAEFVGANLNSGRAIAIGSMLVIVAYLFNVLAALTESASALKYITPNHYLDLEMLTNTKVLQLESLIVLVLGIGLMVVGGWVFKKRDVS